MITRYSQYCLALALLAAPAAVLARSNQVGSTSDSVPTREVAKSEAFSQAPSQETRYDMRQRAAPVLAIDTTRERQAPIPDRRMALQAARYGDGEIEYIEGPSVSYQRSSNGPVFEAGALGGGMESAPFLAHVAMNWQF
jgi:hypothetical protein